MTTALFVLLALASTDGVDRDPDFLAPFLGRSLVDAEDLARDAADPLPLDLQSRQPGPAQSDAPFWAALIPDLSIELVRREVRQLSGADQLGIGSGTILLVEATFGMASDDRTRPTQERRRYRLASASLAAPVPTEVATTPGLPTIAEIQRATEDGALVRLADLDGWRSRARSSAWLPELALSYQRNVGEIDTLGIQSNLGIDSHNVEDVARYGVRATWQLGQLVFSREEVAAVKASMEVQRDRQELVAHVTDLYFDWLRKRARMAVAGGELESLAVAELQAKIDALTNGFLSRWLQRGEP